MFAKSIVLQTQKVEKLKATLNKQKEKLYIKASYIIL